MIFPLLSTAPFVFDALASMSNLDPPVRAAAHRIFIQVRVIAECKNENRLESEFSLLAEVVKFNCSTLLQLEAALAVRPVLRGHGGHSGPPLTCGATN